MKKKRKKKSKNKKSTNDTSKIKKTNYKCIECNKNYSGLSGLYYHNKKYHNKKNS